MESMEERIIYVKCFREIHKGCYINKLCKAANNSHIRQQKGEINMDELKGGQTGTNASAVPKAGEIDFRRTVYELTREYPEIIGIMKELGFESIANEGMLNTAGRFMTIPKGAAMKGINMDRIEKLFEERGYTIIKKEE